MPFSPNSALYEKNGLGSNFGHILSYNKIEKHLELAALKQLEVFKFNHSSALIFDGRCYDQPQKNYPRNINYMPPVIFFESLDFGKNCYSRTAS